MFSKVISSIECIENCRCNWCSIKVFILRVIFSKRIQTRIKFLSSRSNTTQSSKGECSICFYPYDNERIIEKRIKACKHVFCRNCLKKWMKRNNSCPLCRVKIK